MVSEPTYRLTEGYFQFREQGATKVKGVSEPVPHYEVQGVGPLRTRLQVAAWRGLSRFVGRQRGGNSYRVPSNAPRPAAARLWG